MRPTFFVTCCVVVLGCRAASAPPLAMGTRTTATPAVAVPIFAAGLQGEWQDFGWAHHGARKAGAEVLDLSGHAGWILAHRSLKGTFGGLVLRYRAPAALGDFLQVRVDSERADIFPRVSIGPAHRRELPDGWTEVWVSMGELDPAFAPFDRVVLRAQASLPAGTLVEFDGLGLTVADSSLLARAEAAANAPGLPTELEVDCGAPARPINPLIYGIAYSARHEDASSHQWKVGATARRWGGNPTSRYNWELGNAWNAGADYFFRNLDYTSSRPGPPVWERFLDANRERQVSSVLTVPMLGWVARDTSAYGFPVDLVGPQQATDPDEPNAGNGLGKDGQPLEPRRRGAPAWRRRRSSSSAG